MEEPLSLLALEKESGGESGQSRIKIGVGSLGISTWAAGSVIAVEDDEENNTEKNAENTEGNNEEPASKRSKEIEEDSSNVSPVWKYAEKIDENNARCNLCKKVYKMPTTNVIEHILSKHKTTEEGKALKIEVDKKTNSMEQKKRLKNNKETPSITKFFHSPLAISKSERGKIDDALVEYFVARNEPFRAVEDHFFRRFLHKMHSGYTLMSEYEMRRKVDEKIVSIKDLLAEEIKKEVNVHKSVALTSDGGTSGDQNKTKKNTLTLSRITEDWELKTDTLALAKAVGSQTGPVLRAQWKEELCKVSYKPEWRVLITTDAAPNEASARAPGRHDEVGLLVDYAMDCVDHQVGKIAIVFVC